MVINSRLTDIKGIGPETCALLGKLGIYTIWDLVTYFPKSFFDFHKLSSIEEISVDQSLLVLKVISSEYRGVRQKILTILCEDGNGNQIELFCFNRNFYESYAKPGELIYVFGKFQRKDYSNRYISSSFKIISKNLAQQYDFFPNYRLTKGLTSFMLGKLIKQTFNEIKDQIKEILPLSIIKKYSFPPFYEILYNLHFPQNLDIYAKARQYFAYYEFFLYMLKITLLNRVSKIENLKRKKVTSGLQEKFMTSLPFEMTEDQSKAVFSLNKSYNEKQLINTLIQGDVGSGKTVVAFAFALNYVEANQQIAFMAPTEILARQQFDVFQMYCPYVKAAFLSSSTTKKEKTEIIDKLSSGEISIIFGTHSIITENVVFKDLGLAIIDEQQQFGVNQRLALRKKGDFVDLIVISATPIPRTIYLTLYGDLEVITIKTIPKNRKPIKTFFYDNYQYDKIIELVNIELEKGNTGYFVYPVIMENESLELKSAEKMYESIKKTFPNYNVALIHGNMNQKAIKQIMEDFKQKKYQILVATTIVSIGIDIPHATFIVIEECDRYGLSTLHQLRGRVGRASQEAICILTVSHRVSDIAYKRIQYLKENSNGFDIAEFDMKLRGPGEIFGVAQSGVISFLIADFVNDQKIFRLAYQDVKDILNKDPYLENKEYGNLKEYLIDIEKVDKSYLLSG